ncbi:MAG: DUF1501 domain-containing protein [Actinomycetota bacterium]
MNEFDDSTNQGFHGHGHGGHDHTGHDPAADDRSGEGYGFEHGSDCGCDHFGKAEPTESDSAEAEMPQSGLAAGRYVDPSWPAPGQGVPNLPGFQEIDEDDNRFPVSRRRFIQGLAVAGTVGFGVVRGAKPVDQQTVQSQLANRSASTPSSPSTTVKTAVEAAAPVLATTEEFGVEESLLLTPAPVDQRVLVLIEFQGGNDGPSMVVPYASGAYYDLRPGLAIPAEEVLTIDDQVGLAPALSRLHQRQISTVEGVGPVNGVLSHFEMVERWELGDMRGAGGQRAGFLARLSDAVDVGAAVTGLSVAGHTPRFNASQSSTLALSNLNQLRVLTNDDWIYPRYRSALRSFGGGPMSTLMSESWTKLFDVGDSLNGDIERVDNENQMIQEGGRLGRQLAMAAELIKADVGVKVVHAALGGFDTHDGHRGRHNNLMGQFDAAVDGFLQLLEDAGMADRVLVATSSEFGRRLRENGSGLDHGAASSMLVMGPVTTGRAGDPSPVTDLDGNGNLKTTIPFDRYLATLAQDWLGVEAATVLPDSPQPLGLF